MARDATKDRGVGRVILVVGAGAVPHRWENGLAELPVELVASLGDAASLRAEDIVIVDFPELDETATASIVASISGTPATCILTADHEELKVILRSRVAELFRHIVPRGGSAANVLTLLTRLRTRTAGTRHELEVESSEQTRAKSWLSAVELLEWTVSEALRVPGVIVRSYRPLSNKLEIQVVCRLGRDFERFHCELPRRWRWPVRSQSGQVFSQVEREHPSVQNLGAIEQDQEIFVRPIVGSADRAYVAILPWNKDDRITVAMGIWVENGEGERATRARVMTDLHARAVREVPELTLPTIDRTTEGVRYLLEYDWVVTKSHVGPDRRSSDTSFVNRYMFVGRRETIPTVVAQRSGAFSDRVPSWVGTYFAAYAALAVIDTFCTSRFVSAGKVVELNPLLAPLVVHHPWLFLLAKNTFALLSFAIIVRFHLFRRARHVLCASVGLYAALDLYWAILLLGPFMR